MALLIFISIIIKTKHLAQHLLFALLKLIPKVTVTTRSIATQAFNQSPIGGRNFSRNSIRIQLTRRNVLFVIRDICEAIKPQNFKVRMITTRSEMIEDVNK